MAVIDIEYGRAILEDADPSQAAHQKKKVVELEMVLQNSSLAHEYARMELETTQDFLQQEELINKMEDYKRAYFMARRFLKKQDPYRLADLEGQLMDQKVRVFGNYSA